MIKRFYGLNVAVKDLDAATKRYSQVLGVEPKVHKTEDFSFKNLKGMDFFVGDIVITLIASDDPNTSVAGFLDKKGEGVFLISLEVTDIANDMKDLTQRGLQLVFDKPMRYASGQAAWGHPKSMNGVQVELIQPDK